MEEVKSQKHALSEVVGSKVKSDKDNISIITGVLIENEKKEILFVKMPQWNKKWGIVGGHVEYGETVEQGALREVVEETGLKINQLEYLGMDEIVDPEDYKKKKHFVSFVFRARVEGYPELKLEKREILKHKWMTLEDAAKRKDLCSLMRKSIDRLLLGEDCSSCEKYKMGWMRAQADYKNLQKEITEQRGEWAKMSERQILEEFLPVYDNFRKAFDTDDADLYADDADNADVKKWKNWKQGIEYIMKQYWKIMEDHGIVEIRTVGELFNPELHEVMSEEIVEAGLDLPESGRILREISAGYKMGDRVIQVAKVVVAK